MEAPGSSKGKQSKTSAPKMLNQFQFAEMNLRHRGNPAVTTEMVRRAIRMGYDAVVINVDIGEFKVGRVQAEGGDGPPRKKKKKSRQAEGEVPMIASDFIPDPFVVDVDRLNVSDLEVAGKKFRQFSRLTATILDTLSYHKFQNHPKLRLYDVVAVRIEDEQFLETLFKKGDFIDIISIDSANPERVSWFYKPKLLQAIAGVGLSYELVYAGALASTENRRQFLSSGRLLMEITRGGKGVILSSGAEDVLSIRGPYDACNLCTLFGLHHKDSRKLIAANARSVLLRAQARKTIKGAVHVTSNLQAIPSADGVPSDVVLDELKKIPEFLNQLKGPKDGGGTENDSISVVEIE